mgnify:CR=1 FL=1
MTATVRRSGFTIPLSLVVLTSTAMLLAGCQSGGASNANQQGTAGSSSAKAQSTASAKPTSGQKSGNASPRIPSPTGKGSGESAAPQSSSGSGARPSSPRASEPRPAASGNGASKAATPGKADSPNQHNGGASKSPEASSSASQSSGPQAEAGQQARTAAPEAQAVPAPAPAAPAPTDSADGSGGSADKTMPAPAPTEPAAPAEPQAGQATSFVADNLVTEKTAMIVSPSGNIGCDLSAHFAGCGVLSYRSDGTFGQDAMGSPNWWFDLSSGATPQLGGRGEGAFSLDEAFRGPGSSSPQVVEYGQSVTFGSWVCSSEETGMTCRNTETGHGVFLSSARYETF